jgi:hypothetical protein
LRVAKRVVIVGDVSDRPDRKTVLADLSRRRADIEWSWIQAEGAAFNLPPKYFQPLLHELRTLPEEDKPLVVLLGNIHGRDRNTLFASCADPVRGPAELSSAQELCEWIVSDEAGLYREPPWTVNCRQAALLALLSKLVRNKSWNKDTQGHAWTKEADLMGQAPVYRAAHQDVYREAIILLEMLKGTLLLTKGGNQGKTPKEWSINTTLLPEVKRVMNARSFVALRGAAQLVTAMAYVDGLPAEAATIVIEDSIVSEKVLSICRER